MRKNLLPCCPMGLLLILGALCGAPSTAQQFEAGIVVQDHATALVLTSGDLNLSAGPVVADYDLTCSNAPSHPR